MCGPDCNDCFDTSFITLPTGDAGAPGSDGSDGNTVLNNAGTPAGSLGVNGDFCLDTTNTILYGPKTAGTWGSGISLIGPSGIAPTWKFSTTTTPTPASTYIRFNSNISVGISKIYVHKTGATGTTKEEFLYGLLNGSSNYRFGTLTVSKVADAESYIMFDITGFTDQVTYMEFDVEPISAASVLFANDTVVSLHFTPAEEVLKTVILPISNWNMDTTNLFNVPHGLGADFNKIRSVEVMIINDTGTAMNSLEYFNGTVTGGGYQINNTNIVLFCTPAGPFDAASYSGAGDRGHVTFKYLKS